MDVDDNQHAIVLVQPAVSRSVVDINIESLKQWDLLRHLPDVFLSAIRHARVTKDSGVLVTSDDVVYVIGSNKNGILGLNPATTDMVVKPTRVDSLCDIGINDIKFGKSFCLAKTKDGKLYGWGKNDVGQLGLGHTQSIYIRRPVVGPQEIKDLKGHVTGFTCGSNFGLATTGKKGDDSQAWVWGQQVAPGPYIVTPEATKMCSFVFSLGATASTGFVHYASGMVLTRGSNRYGELGGGTTAESNALFECMEIMGAANNIMQIACGENYCLALTDDGEVLGWGRNEFGELGLGRDSPPHVLAPQRIEFFAEKVQGISACNLDTASYCQTASNKVYVWGRFKNEVIYEPKQTNYKSIDEAIADNKLSMHLTWNAKTEEHGNPALDLLTYLDDPTRKDVKFEVEGRIIEGCKFLLERSKYLKEKFETEWRDHPRARPIVIANFKYPEFAAFIHFLHSDVIEIENHHLPDLLRLAHVCDMKLLHQKVVLLLERWMTVGNIVTIYNAAVHYKAPDLRLTSLQFIGANFANVNRAAADMNAYSRELLGTLWQDLQSMDLI